MLKMHLDHIENLQQQLQQKHRQLRQLNQLLEASEQVTADFQQKHITFLDLLAANQRVAAADL